MFNHIKMSLLVGCLSLLLPGVALAELSGEHIFNKGNGRGADACNACHAVDGGGVLSIGTPRLAGLHAGYIEKQIKDFASGRRLHVQMKPIAKALSQAEMEAVSKYLSGLPLPERKIKQSLPMADESVGARLALRGRWEANIPACIQCHAFNGGGVGASFPAISGQGAVYIANQLNAWKNGARDNDPIGLMRQIASKLSREDIDSVAQWFGAQNATKN
ncbi:MAG: c-type cytochrome [Neisseriaceae bacterium]|nr:c-type cytochrome [Neisseriaceae bacterium]